VLSLREEVLARLVWTDRVSEVPSVSIIRTVQAVRTSETSVSLYQTTRRNIPEDSHRSVNMATGSGRKQPQKITGTPVIYLWAGVAQSVQCLTTDWAAGVRSPTEAEDFPSNLCVQTGSGAHRASRTVGTGGALSPGVKRGRGVMLTAHPLLVPRSSKSRSCTSCRPKRLHGVKRDHFIFTFYQWFTYCNQSVACEVGTLWSACKCKALIAASRCSLVCYQL
jgi:hypothetical protein